MMKITVLSVLAVLMLGSCSTSTKALYSWYNYEDATYRYSKKRTDELKVKVLEQYKKLVDKQKGTRGTVPPGLYAEYGYMLCMSGKKDEGLDFLKKETQLYPESEKYISRIIKQLEK